MPVFVNAADIFVIRLFVCLFAGLFYCLFVCLPTLLFNKLLECVLFGNLFALLGISRSASTDFCLFLN